MRRVWNIGLIVLSLAVHSVFANSSLLSADESVPNLRWRNGVIRIAVSSSLLRENPNIKKDSDVAGALRRSIEAWSRAANIEIQQVPSDKLSASAAGVAGDGISLVTIAPTAENVLLFTKDPENAAGTTRIFYNRRGFITEADIVLNPYQQFSTDGTLGTFDLESTFTHEIGHLLGLTHSNVLGSTMHTSYGKNGVFGLQNLSSRTLSADDIASVRSIYGVREDAGDCCGTVEGKLTLTGKQARSIQIWLEDSAGRVNASTRTGTDGDFQLSGLTGGRYRLLAQESPRSKTVVPVRELGEVVVANGETTIVNTKIAAVTRDFDLTYLGFNGQLSEMAVGLSSGRTYTIYLGGRNLDPKRINVTFSSTSLSVIPGTARALDYGDEIDVIAVDVRVANRTQPGEYTIFVESDRGEKRAIIGGLAVDTATN